MQPGNSTTCRTEPDRFVTKVRINGLTDDPPQGMNLVFRRESNEGGKMTISVLVCTWYRDDERRVAAEISKSHNSIIVVIAAEECFKGGRVSTARIELRRVNNDKLVWAMDRG